MQQTNGSVTGRLVNKVGFFGLLSFHKHKRKRTPQCTPRVRFLLFLILFSGPFLSFILHIKGAPVAYENGQLNKMYTLDRVYILL